MSGRGISRVVGRAVVLAGDDIDTDRIIPARFLKSITFDGLGAQVFADDRAQESALGRPHPFDAPGAAGATVLIVGANFGCGSSREHAPRAIAQWGIDAVIGVSFAEIFFSNAVAIGLPCVSMAREDLDACIRHVQADPGVELTVDVAELSAAIGGRNIAIALPAMGRDALLSGQWDATGLLLDRYEQVDAVAGRLPYLRGFQAG